MTIICYRDGCIAADTQMTEGSLRTGRARKIARTKQGWLVGASGRASDAQAFLIWAASLVTEAPPSKMPFTTDDARFEGLIAKSPTELYLYDNLGRYAQIDAPYIALGSGGFVAMGAMAAGANARRAVRLAIDLDVFCGGEVELLYHAEEAL